MTLAALFKESQQDKENWRYTSLKPFADIVFGQAPEAAEACLPAPMAPLRLVFINGRFCCKTSLIDGFAEFVTVDQKTGTCRIEVGAQTCLALQPLEILFVNEGRAASWQKETVIELALGANSRLTLVERYVHSGDETHAHLPELKIVLAEQAKLVHGRLLSGSTGGLHLSKTKVDVAAGAFYDQFALIQDGRLTRCETDVHLKGELSGAHVSGAALLRGASHADMVARVFHEAPYGTSRQLFKAVLDDKARCAFQGKIHVAQEAQKTDGHQISRALLLSDRAEMNAKPELEIYADDVKCSHGSAIGDLSEQELFYLQARGIPAPQARAMLIEAFIKEEIDQIQSAELATAARKMVEQWLIQK